MRNKLKLSLERLRQEAPLVLCITNQVTMDLIANGLLALGASPLMSTDECEVMELVRLSQAVVLNMGTLNKSWTQYASQVLAEAQHASKPIILDPVGAGASLVRTQLARDWMPHVDMIRGNASEVMALQMDQIFTKGVDSYLKTHEVTQVAASLARQWGVTIIVSGVEDFITDGSRSLWVQGGSPLMTKVTGMGCLLTAVIAAFRCLIQDPFEASVLASQYYSFCGSLAHEKSRGPGRFRSEFLDALYGADFESMAEWEYAHNAL